MNRKQVLERAIELKECSEEFESVTFLDSDTEFFADVVEIIQRTAQEVPVQEQYDMNFNPNTGEKLHDICPKCWVKGNKPFNCGFNTCPGYKLHTLSINKKY